jgi:hypothetical protein
MIDYKYPTIASGATLRRSLMKSKEENFESIIGGKHQKINSTFYSHRESGFKNPTILAIALEVED